MSESTLPVYESLYSLNQAVKQASDALLRLQELNFLKGEYVGYNIAVIEHYRTGINYRIIGQLERKEAEQWKEFQDKKLEYENKLAETEARLEQAVREKPSQS